LQPKRIGIKRKLQQHRFISFRHNPIQPISYKITVIPTMNLKTSNTLLLIVMMAVAWMDATASSTSTSNRSRKPFTKLPFLRRDSTLTSQRISQQQQQQQQPRSSSYRTTRQCFEDDEPSDCEARFAMQYGHEIQSIRTTEHAYLLHDEEFPIIPASNKRIVRTGRPDESDLTVV
jgi:hypothetical protein